VIGVVAPQFQHDVVREFFELFKTPWEFARRDGCYDVVICTENDASDIAAKLTLVYQTFNQNEKPPDLESCKEVNWMCSPQGRMPVYCGLQALDGKPFYHVVTADSRRACAVSHKSQNRNVIHIGFNLFAEVTHLLVVGQPVANASVPTLDRHIALLRQLITRAGVPLVEIPPVPDGSPFAVCLTHDVDHPVMRNHLLDSTMLGFVYRATLGSVVGVWRGRVALPQLCRNWLAVLKLPFLYLGLVRDIWRKSLCDYGEIENKFGSTFFVIPFRGRPGQSKNGEVPARRAAKYGVGDVRTEIQSLQKKGCEIGVHGIDAWSDVPSARTEMQEIASHVSDGCSGVRMHWLFFDSGSYEVLDQAGFSYDSTLGYNETVGYKAGTGQAFRPLGAKQLIELPLHIMDTSLFYPAHLNLSANEARERVGELIDNAEKLGGVMTINWHDRSVAPERLWGGFYQELLKSLEQRGAWFPTGSQIVAWYRRRRSVRIEELGSDEKQFRVRVTMDEGQNSPGLRLRFHKPVEEGAETADCFEDVPLRDGEIAFAI